MSKDATHGHQDHRHTGIAPVPDDAIVLRRIHQNFVDRTKPLPVLPAAFRPSPSDTDGLSVYLDHEHGGPRPAGLAASGRGGAENYVVVALRVGDLRALGLTVIAKDIPDGLPGHAVIPELNVVDYQSGKQAKRRQKALQVNLCELASERIVHPLEFSADLSS